MSISTRIVITVGFGIIVANGNRLSADVITSGSLVRTGGPPVGSGLRRPWDEQVFDTTVDRVYFTVNTAGSISLDMLSWELDETQSELLWDSDDSGYDALVTPTDVNSDGEAAYFDTHIHLFHDDGSLDTGDYIAYNDDPGDEPWVDGKGDGSISPLDSFLSENLAEGDYVLAIGANALDTDEAISQTSVSYGLLTNEMPYPSQVKYSDHGDWRLTITGDVTITDVQTGSGAGEPIPEPGTLALLGLGAAAAGLAKRRRQKRAAA